MTCKDCLHYEVCDEQKKINHKLSKSICKRFKDKSRFIELPCRVGGTVFVIESCSNVAMSIDNDYFNGTGAVECPFENDCERDDCCDDCIRIFETTVTEFSYRENDNKLYIYLKNMMPEYVQSDIGKTVFLSREEAEKALKEQVGEE